MEHCFSRINETTNQFENKNICLKIAEVLLDFGADLNKYCMNMMSHTYLMHFCSIQMKLGKSQLDTCLEVIKFLLEHGADPTLECK